MGREWVAETTTGSTTSDELYSSRRAITARFTVLLGNSQRLIDQRKISGGIGVIWRVGRCSVGVRNPWKAEALYDTHPAPPAGEGRLKIFFSVLVIFLYVFNCRYHGFACM